MSDCFSCHDERECHICSGSGKLPVCVEGCGDIITSVIAYVMCDACNGTGIRQIYR